MSSDATESEDKIFELLAEQKKALERRLLRNIILQLLAAILASSFLFHFSEKFDKYLRDELMIEDTLAQVLLVLSFLFLFIEFGFATIKFFIVSSKYKEMTTQLVDSYLKQAGHEPESDTANELRSDYRVAFASFNIFDQLIGKKGGGHVRIQYIIALACVIVVFVANHFATFLLLEANFQNNQFGRVCTKIVLIIIMLLFYVMYHTSKNIKGLNIKKDFYLVTGISFLVVFYFVLDEIIPGINIPLTSFSGK